MSATVFNTSATAAATAFWSRRRADQPLDDGRGCILGDGAHVAHGRLLGGGDGLFGGRQLGVERVLDLLAGGLGVRRLALARLVGDGLGAAARVGQRLLVGRHRLVGLLLEAAGLGDVAFDALLAVLEDAADLRQRQLRHQHVEQHKGNNQPDELRGEGLRLERRKRAVFALRDLGTRVMCRFGHRLPLGSS